jgi:hypothetical protein
MQKQTFGTLSLPESPKNERNGGKCSIFIKKLTDRSVSPTHLQKAESIQLSSGNFLDGIRQTLHETQHVER